MRNKRSYAPESSDSECNNKCESDEASRYGAVAPALEHGSDSNHEEQDGNDRNCLKPHSSSPRSPCEELRNQDGMASAEVTDQGDGRQNANLKF